MRCLWSSESGLFPQPVRAGPLGNAASGAGDGCIHPSRGLAGAAENGHRLSGGGIPGGRPALSAGTDPSWHTSFTMRQTARRVRDETLIASAEFVFVCIDREGRPIPVPPEFTSYMHG